MPDPSASAGEPVTRVEAGQIHFVLPGERDADAVRLWQDAGLSPTLTTFERGDHGWTLGLPLDAIPDLLRLEYQFVVSADGQEKYLLDPAMPRVGGAFGDKSSLELPGYRPPAWVDRARADLSLGDPFSVETALGTFDLLLCSPTGDGTVELPLLVVHDGPEMATYARILDFSAAMMAAGQLVSHRVLLLAPGDRDRRYAANDAYADVLAEELLPAANREVATAPDPVIVGASLGGLAALHAEWRRPGTFAGVLAQSGSFFTAQTDPQESGFAYFSEITSFVQQVLTAQVPATFARVALICGRAEENIHCNRLVAERLASLGIGEELVEHRDLHNWVCWRDTFDPTLTALLQQVWGRPGEPRGAEPSEQHPSVGGSLPNPSVEKG